MAELIVAAIECLVHVWDLITYPISYIVWQPWSKLKNRDEPRSKTKLGKCELEFRPVPITCPNREDVLHFHPKIDTVDKLFDRALQLFGPNPCLGIRQVKNILKVEQPDDIVLTKLDLDDEYSWTTYEEVGSQVEMIANGLHSIGLRPNDKVLIYADTCPGWLMTALACFKSSITIVTVYTNLGKSGVSFSVNQVKGRILVTSQDLLDKVGSMLDEWPYIQKIIYFENKAKNSTPVVWNHSRVELIPFQKLLKANRSFNTQRPTPEDIAVIMYTSGSTGQPKGVLLSHSNLLSSLMSACPLACNLLGDKRSPSETYLAYLPLAHIFELTHEILVLSMGIKVGYSSPNTLTDASTMILKGQRGDTSVLRPTTMPCVPIILDRIYKGVRAKIQMKGRFFVHFFEFCYRYRKYWVTRGFDTPLLNLIVFKKFQMALGGRMRAIIAGGAPLSPDVHEFLRICLRVNLAQGYGLTETVGGISLSDCDDLSVGRVGRPLPDVIVKLKNWEEGGYTVNDTQGPRGEIIVGGPLVANGYYELPEKTAESFYEENGIKWFKTGDIGQLSEMGTLMIIDRKKDLVKLQMGEYISLGKVEACLKTHPLVDNICVYADSSKMMSVALVVPNQIALMSMVSINGSKITMEEICDQSSVVTTVLKELSNHAAKYLEKFEIPKMVSLISDLWTPDTGLVTAAMKLKRKQIQMAYQRKIDEMYELLSEIPTTQQKI